MRWAHEADGERGADEAMSWGFGRYIGPEEAGKSAWYRVDDYLIVWFHTLASDPGAFSVHVVVRPEDRGKISLVEFREVWTVMRALAQIMGAERLRYMSGPGFREVEPLARRFGWSKISGGFEYDLRRR